MITGDDIGTIVKAAAELFKAMLTRFRLAEGANAFPERNLSFQFSHAFLQRFPQGGVFLEPTFDGTKHLDALLIADESAIALECKRLWVPTQVTDIAADAARLSDTLFDTLSRRFVPVPPRRWFAMLLIEAWNEDHLAWWKGAPDAKCQWTRPDFLSRYVTDGLGLDEPITSGDEKRYPLHWLYAYRMLEKDKTF